MNIVGCLLLIYVASVARMMHGPVGGFVDLSAVAVIVAVRWCSPSAAACLALLAGCLIDALGTGFFGAHAAAAVAVAGIFSVGHDDKTAWSTGTWILATGVMTTANAFVLAVEQLAGTGRSGHWKLWLESQSMTVIATAVAMGLLVRSGQMFFGAACATR